jgi:hypothetical protein
MRCKGATGAGSSASSSSSAHTSAAAVRRRMAEMAPETAEVKSSARERRDELALAHEASKGRRGDARYGDHVVDIHEVAGRLRRGEVVGDDDADWLHLLQV